MGRNVRISRIDLNDMGCGDMNSVQDAICQEMVREMSDEPEKMRAQSLEILAYLPAPVKTHHTHCDARRYDLEIPIGRSADFCFFTR